MIIKDLNRQAEFTSKKYVLHAYEIFENFLNELRKQDLPDKIVLAINKYIDELNIAQASARAIRALIRKKQTNIIQLLEKDLKLVCKNHYRNKWLAVGMAAIGIPFGVMFGTILGNMAFLGIGLPIGMAIGIAIGTDMDRKASKEGRQLDIEFEM
ncbi:MAG: hypothetical protein WCT23_08670 [Candidatus Neomarinimicrobiota bacterium]